MSEEEKESQLIEETEIEIQNLHEYMKIYQLEYFFLEKLILIAFILKYIQELYSKKFITGQKCCYKYILVGLNSLIFDINYRIKSSIMKIDVISQ